MEPISILNTKNENSERPILTVNKLSLKINKTGYYLICPKLDQSVNISFLKDEKFPDKLFIQVNDDETGYVFYKSLRSALSVHNTNLAEFFFDFFKLKPSINYYDNPTLLIEPKITIDNVSVFPLSVYKNNIQL